MCLGAWAVLAGHTTVGHFLATIHVYRDLGERFEGLYCNIRSGLRVVEPLLTLTLTFNLQTDIAERMKRNRRRRQYTHTKLEELEMQPASDGRVFFDSMPIEFE